MSEDRDRREVLEHYALGFERDRLSTPVGEIEFERTEDELDAHLLATAERSA